MEDIERSQGNFTRAGITVIGLPAQYADSHPACITAELGSLREDDAPRNAGELRFELKFKYPPVLNAEGRTGGKAAPGFFVIDLKEHPLNHRLAELVKAMAEQKMDIDIYGRRYRSRYYVRGFCPAADGAVSRKAFFYLISRIGLRYEFPETVRREGSREDAEGNCALIYKLFRDEYPNDIRRYLDEYIGSPRHSEAVKRFILTDWKPPVLNLPTAKQARRILDKSVYGMEEVKERILEFLEVIRRSGRLGRNLLLVGPPGTGKTTILQTVAKLLGLPMSVVPMSACTDLSTFVGFARTYSNSQEGLATTALLSPTRELPDGRRETVRQFAQVMFFNELDKTDTDTSRHGSVQSAILRMTDDNRSFFDVYHQVNFDLSNVLIVADANDVSRILPPLLDRFEVVEIAPYTESEKAFIFRNYTFPSVLREKKVAPSEVSVTEEAAELIVSSAQTAGIREMKRTASRIVGNYLLHYSRRKGRVCYTPEMVRPLLPGKDIRQVTLERMPGTVVSACYSGGRARPVIVQCLVTPSAAGSFRLYGADWELLRQELEAAAACACTYLPHRRYNVTVQLIGPEDSREALGQLGFAVFAAILSAANDCVIPGMFYGGMTLLGGLTCCSCGDPNAIRTLAERMGETRFYTAAGFSRRLSPDCRGEVCEFLNAGAAAALLFGGELRKAI